MNGPKKYIVQHYRGGGNCRRRKVAKDSCGRAGHRNLHAKKIVKKLEEHLMQGSVRELWQKAPGSSGAGTSSEAGPSSPTPHKIRRQPKFVPSPSPEPVRGQPHHPARTGKRSSSALAAWSPGQ